MKQRDTHRELPRRDEIKSHLIAPHWHDPYKARHKLPSPCVCPQCGAVFQAGRWQWLDAPEGASKEVCPACRRTNDKFPAGEIRLSGLFFQVHREEILGLVRNEQEDENVEHPLARIIDVADTGDETVVTTTDIHLPRRVGHALEHAYKGTLKVHYNEEEYFVRVHWRRDS